MRVDEMNSTEKVRENDNSLTSLDALIKTQRDETDCIGVPEIVPVEESRVRPEGRDPEVMENTKSSPLTIGVTKNDSSLARA